MALISVQRFQAHGGDITDNVSVVICSLPAAETTNTKGHKIGGHTRPCGNPGWQNQPNAKDNEVWVEKYFNGIRQIVPFSHLLVDVSYAEYMKKYHNDGLGLK